VSIAIWPLPASAMSLMPTEFNNARNSARICPLSSTISALRFSKPGPDMRLLNALLFASALLEYPQYPGPRLPKRMLWNRYGRRAGAPQRLAGRGAALYLLACLLRPRQLAKRHECDGDPLADPPGGPRRCRAGRGVERRKLRSRPFRQIRLPPARRRESGCGPVFRRHGTRHSARLGAFLADPGGRA